MKEELQQIVKNASEELASIKDLQALEQLRARFIGKKGYITEYLKKLAEYSPAERPQVGQVINDAKEKIMQLFSTHEQGLKQAVLNAKLSAESIDVTLPGRGQGIGSIHPVTLTRQRIEKFFTQAGFSVAEGPELEDDYHNFVALNIPDHHPARADHATFYFDDGKVLRTHTSTVQIRVMETTKPPIKVIAPGRVYRCDSDLRHTPMFHQVEGLVVDEKANFAELKALLHAFLQDFFHTPNIKVRFRPAYFPFTEPSAEVDVQCVMCKGEGCRVCSKTGWLEILGCGMVHPNVFKSVGIDSERYLGYAFGMGIDRLAMLQYGIPDLRMMFENDLRFLRQF